MTQGDHTELQAHLHAAFGALLDAVAYHKGHNALGLVVLDHLYHVGGVLGLAQDYGHAGDIAGDQRHTQGTDDGIGHEADAGLILIGLGPVYIFQAFQDLRAYGGSQTGVEGLTQILLIGDQALQHAYAGGQIPQGLYLYAGSGINGGEEIGGVGEGDLLIRAVLGDGIVHCALGQARDRIGTTVDQIG